MARVNAEFLIPGNIRNGEPLLRGLAAAATEFGDRVTVRLVYQGKCQWLVLYGVGAPGQDVVRRTHLHDHGHHVLHWDGGYFGRAKKGTGYMRVSIDRDHPQAWLDKTPADPSRWEAHEIALREDGNPGGHILLVGLGKKSRSYLRADNWEAKKLVELQRRFPGRRIVYRPKPKHQSPVLSCETDAATPIEKLLRGCALVVCRHSNVAVDGIVAGVPFEAEDGAAMWMRGKPFTVENRLDFLRRLAWWQWKTEEAPQAWAFLRGIVQ